MCLTNRTDYEEEDVYGGSKSDSLDTELFKKAALLQINTVSYLC